MKKTLCVLLSFLMAMSCFSFSVMAEAIASASSNITKTIEPVIVTPTYEADDVIVAEIVLTETNYGVDPRGVKDSTSAIQTALFDMMNLGGGVVYLPAGKYLIKNSLYIPSGCMLQGDWQDPNSTATPEYGTVILACPNPLTEKEINNHDAAPLVRVATNAAICGMTFYYPNQSLDNPIPYGYTIYAHGFSFATVRDITLINSFRGIGASPEVASGNHEMMQIERVRICALDVAMRMSYSSEVGYTTDVHISPNFWSNAGCGYAYPDAAKLRAYCKENTMGMVLDRLDDETFSEIVIDGVRTAMYMPNVETNSHFWGLIYDLVITDCMYGIVADALNNIGQVFAKVRIDADVKAIVNAASYNGALKLCDVQLTGDGEISSEGGRIAYDNDIDLSSCNIKEATYHRPASILYPVDLTEYNQSLADAAPVIQSALDQAAATGGIVYVPAGIYSLYTQLNVPVGVQLRGATPLYTRDQTETQDVGTAFLTYVTDRATIVLNQNAGVNGIRLFGLSYSPEAALPEMQNKTAVTQTCIGIKGNGSGVYAVNVGIAATFIGIDFTGCDNHVIKNAFGGCYNVFARVGGKNGVIEQCLCNPSFIKRPHLWKYINEAVADKSGWESFDTENGSLFQTDATTGVSTPTVGSQKWAQLRDTLLRENATMVEVVGATNQAIQNIFMYAVHTFIRVKDSSATILNTSVDFLGWGCAYDVSNNSDVLAVNSLRVFGNCLKCDETSNFDLYNRTTYGIYVEGTFHSSDDNVDKFDYTITDKKTLFTENNTLYPKAYVTVNTDSTYIKEGSSSLKHEGVGTSTNEVILHVNMTKAPNDISDYMNGDGYLHMWVYLEDPTKFVGGGNIAITSSGNGNDPLYWAFSSYMFNTGWTELMLPLHNYFGKSAAFDPTNVNFMYINGASNVFMGQKDVYIDDVYVCKATSSDECVLWPVTPNPTPNEHIPTSTPNYQYGEVIPPVDDPMAPTHHKLFITDCDSTSSDKLASYTSPLLTTAENYVKQGHASWMYIATGVGTRSIFAIKFNDGTEGSTGMDISDYMENGYLHFWFYVEDASTITGGQIELTSCGTYDTEELVWHPKKYIKNDGWNEIILPLKSPDGRFGNAFDPTNANYLRLYLQSTENTGNMYLLDDLYIAREREKKVIVNSCDTGASVNTDTAYIKEGTGSWMGHSNTEVFRTSFSPVDLTYHMDTGYLHFWLYVSDISKITGGQIELTSSGSPDKQEICWDPQNYILQNGWNEIILPLNQSTGKNNTGGNFAPVSANFIRMYAYTSDGTYPAYYIDDIYFDQHPDEHDWGAGTVTAQPTHLTEGVKAYTCKYCGNTKTEPIAKLSDCTFGDWTEHDDAQHVRSCKCGKTEYAPHAWDNGTVTAQPSYTQNSVRVYTCNDCNATKMESIPMLVQPGSSGLVYAANETNTQITITGYNGTATKVVIPATWYGIPVTALAEDAFGSSNSYEGDLSDGIILPDDSFDSIHTCVDQITFLSKTIAIPDSAYAIPSSVVLCGYANSTAHKYAQKYDREFILLAEIYSASVSLGADVTVVFSAYLGNNQTNAVMEFTIKNKTVTVKGVPTATPNKYQFAFEGVSPHMMGDTICARLMLDGQELAVVDGYSVKQYCLNMKTRAEARTLGLSDEKHAALATLVADILEYGAASQMYTNYKTDDLVNSGVDGASEFVSLGEEFKMPPLAPTAMTGYAFRSAKVELSNVVRLYFTITAVDISRVSVKIDNMIFDANDFTSDTTTINGVVTTVWELRSSPIYANHFDDGCVAVLCVDGVPCQTLTYSVVNYIYNMQNSTADANFTALLKRIRCYGLSAETYATTK